MNKNLQKLTKINKNEQKNYKNLQKCTKQFFWK